MTVDEFSNHLLKSMRSAVPKGTVVVMETIGSHRSMGFMFINACLKLVTKDTVTIDDFIYKNHIVSGCHEVHGNVNTHYYHIQINEKQLENMEELIKQQYEQEFINDFEELADG